MDLKALLCNIAISLHKVSGALSLVLANFAFMRYSKPKTPTHMFSATSPKKAADKVKLVIT